MRITHLNNSDITGGAARAAYRIHQSILRRNVHSRMWVKFSQSDDWTVIGPKEKWKKGFAQLRRHIISPAIKMMKSQNKILHSPAILPSSWSNKLNSSDTDLVHLHWLGAEMASIADIGAINKPVVWTLHDMWAFCGAEHVSWDNRWQEGYKNNNRPNDEKGFDINRWTWNRKLKYWKRPFHIIAPSKWLADCAKKSVIMRDWKIDIIPNCLDIQKWAPVEKNLARKLIGLPKDIPLIAFGSYGANNEYHKGYDLLIDALKDLKSQIKGVELVIFGQSAPQKLPDLNFPVHYTGLLHDDISLRLLFSAANLVVVPSRKEAFGQTAIESMACSTPVVAFGSTGLLDIIDHKVNGYLAKPFQSEDLANGIKYILETSKYEEFCNNARMKVIKQFDSSVVSEKYLKIYHEILR